MREDSKLAGHSAIELEEPPVARDGAGLGPEFVLTLWTDDPLLAGYADMAGIQRVGVDLETLGKAERQRGFGTWISTHRIEQLADVGSALRNALLFARTNPLHPGSRDEVDQLVALGVRVLMLPMFGTSEEVARFVDIVAGRALVVPLLETRSAAEQIPQLVLLDGIDEIHVGLNDLAISLGARMRFEVLTSSLLERVASCVREAGLRFGVGAIGRVDDPSLPVPSDLLYARYVELGASAALIARAFVRDGITHGELARDVARSRQRLAWWRGAGAQEHNRAYRALRRTVASCDTW